MYEAFYNLSEKPFTLLPDPGFLYMSDKHRMAFTMLEYGLMNHAGFTVISGDIGAGKTTLIRHLLDHMDREHTVGLISNTHSSFGELLEWILMAFNLEHAGMNKVQMYQRFVDFIIDEYAHNRRTVLIVDEAQNMSAETLEELRMLSNINADKDQALQVVLVGQNELRDTLQRPDLVQFAQRISVDYHLQPLSEDETANYIGHRLKVAGGSPDAFSELACRAVHRYSNGVPRLINLLCDTALVYGYAEQKQQIDARLVTQVAREKQLGGIFPTFEPALDEDFPVEAPGPAATPAHSQAPEVAETRPDTGRQEQPDPGARSNRPAEQPQPEKKSLEEVLQAAESPAPAATAPRTVAQPDTDEPAKSEGELYWEQQTAKKKICVALYAPVKGLRKYLSRLLESYGLEVVNLPLPDNRHPEALDLSQLDILLVDGEEDATRQPADIAEFLAHWDGPVLYNDSTATAVSLRKGNPDFGKVLSEQIVSLVDTARTTGTAVNH